jgi:hypothetical protein
VFSIEEEENNNKNRKMMGRFVFSVGAAHPFFQMQFTQNCRGSEVLINETFPQCDSRPSKNKNHSI